ncbi:hypothetical protein LTR95_012221 [Oleoguttula sp. CCFEE 5521]
MLDVLRIYAYDGGGPAIFIGTSFWLGSFRLGVFGLVVHYPMTPFGAMKLASLLILGRSVRFCQYRRLVRHIEIRELPCLEWNEDIVYNFGGKCLKKFNHG